MQRNIRVNDSELLPSLRVVEALQATSSFSSCDMKSVPGTCRSLRCDTGEDEMACWTWLNLPPVVYRTDPNSFWTPGTDCPQAGQKANRKTIPNQRGSRRVRRWVKKKNSYQSLWRSVKAMCDFSYQGTFSVRQVLLFFLKPFHENQKLLEHSILGNTR